MKNYSKFFLLCIISLLFCLTAVSANDLQNDSNTIQVTEHTQTSTISTENNEVGEKKIIKTDKINKKEASQTVNVTSSNYDSYFQTDSSGSTNTTNQIKSGNIINLQGTFKNVTFNADKKSLTITSIGKKAKLLDCTVIISESGTGSKVSNLTINNVKDECEGIIIDHASNVAVKDNTVHVSGRNDFALTAYNMKKCTIENNYFESTHTQSNVRIYSSENNNIIGNTVIGQANGIYLCAYGGNLSNNNVIRENTVIGKSEFSTCYPIQLMGNNNIVEKNTVTGGNRGISSENSNIIRNNNVNGAVIGIFTGENSTITDNNIIVSKETTGIIVEGDRSIIKNNVIQSDFTGIEINTNDLIINDNTIISKDMSIYSSSTTRGFKNITIANNNITGQIYNTGSMKLTNNDINGNINNIGGEIIASGNRFTNNSKSFKINGTEIILVDVGNYIPENASVSIYEKGSLIKNTNMHESKINYQVPNGLHEYNLIITNTSSNSFKNNNFTVNNENRTQLTLKYNKISSPKINTTIKISGKLLNKTEAVLDETITITIKGKKYTTKTDENGAFTINYTVKSMGTHDVIFEHKATSKYLSNLETTNFTVSKQDTKISVTKIKSVAYGENITVTGKLTDKSGKALGNVSVKVTVNAKTATVKTSNGGVYKYVVKAGKVGTNNVTLTFAGNTYYNKITNKATVKITKQNTKVTVAKIKSVAYGENITVTGKLTDKYGKIISNANVKVTVNAKTGTVKTNNKGVYKYVVKAGKVGTNNVTLTFAGNTYYNKISKKATVKITKQTTKITVTATKQVKYANKVTVTGKLTDKHGKLLTNRQVKIILNGKTVSAKTNNKGVYKTTIATNKIGTNNVTVTYAGNTYYNKITKKTTFKVIKQNVVLTVSSIKQVTNKKQAKVTGKLADANGKVLKNTNVVLKVNNAKKTVKTNSKGVYTVTVNAKAGNNKLIASFNGNTYYNKYTAKTKTFKIS